MHTTHHAYVYTAVELPSELPTVCATPSVDVVHIVADTLGIDEVRDIIQTAYTKPVVSEKRYFVLKIGSATEPAQNALLKLLEDPPETAEFHVIVPNLRLLIPTLRSRLQHIDIDRTASDIDSGWTEFKAMKVGARLELIAAKHKAKDLAWETAIVAAAGQDQTLDRAVVLLVDQYFKAPGASKKMLLEELALSIDA